MCAGRIKITEHARLRLKERVMTHEGYRTWERLVRAARYKGRNQNMMTREEYAWFSASMSRSAGSMQVRIYKGFAYEFDGKKERTLITVISMEKSGRTEPTSEEAAVQLQTPEPEKGSGIFLCGEKTGGGALRKTVRRLRKFSRIPATGVKSIV